MVPFKKTTIFVGVDNLREEIVKNFLKNKRVKFAYNALLLSNIRIRFELRGKEYTLLPMRSEDIATFIENHSVVFKNTEYYTLPALEDTDQFHVDYIKLAGIKYNEASITTKSGERIYCEVLF